MMQRSETEGFGLHRISWGSIFAGTLLAIGVQLVLSLAGIAAGLASFPGSDASTSGVASAAWWTISSIIALAVGAYATGVLSGSERALDGMFHGLSVWALTLVILLGTFATGAISLLGGTVNTISSVAGSAGQGAGGAISSAVQQYAPSPQSIQDAAGQLFGQATGQDPNQMNPEQIRDEVVTTLPQLIQGGPAADAARQRVAELVAAQAKISPQDAQQRVNQTVQQLQQTRDQAVQQAQQAAEQARQASVTGALYGTIGLVIGALVTMGAGALGARRNDTAVI